MGRLTHVNGCTTLHLKKLWILVHILKGTALQIVLPIVFPIANFQKDVVCPSIETAVMPVQQHIQE